MRRFAAAAALRLPRSPTLCKIARRRAACDRLGFRASAMHQVVKRVNRSLISVASLFLPQEKSRELERLRRGKEEYRRLQLADYVFVSFGKSGRTWLRVMLSRYYQLAHGAPERSILRFDNYYNINPAVPRIFFTHGNYVRDYTGHHDTKQDFYDKSVILLVRRPQDVAVSQYFQWKYRMPARKKGLNQYPAHGADVSLYEFVLHPRVGLPGIVAFMNGWADELPKLRDHLVLRYEDMHADPALNLRRLVDFLGMRPEDAWVDEAVRFASADNLRELERRRFFRGSGIRMRARDRRNPDSYKVRRAKVGGYRDYFDDEQLSHIDALVRSSLSPIFGYDEADAALAAGLGSGQPAQQPSG
ncbi:MAG TPA: sulfotransferase domain-containing protein [Geminicoccaceae bacterium]|nr:sulfotransferase domain-containing protein [Geminicoccaceae bacterium]